MKKKILIISIVAMAAVIVGVAVIFGQRSDQADAELIGSFPAQSITALGSYDYTEAPDHIGERATVRGKILKVFTSKSGVTFLDFCKTSKCPFSAVIFKDSTEKFGDLQRFVREVRLNGIVRSYEGSAEMILDDPSQIE